MAFYFIIFITSVALHFYFYIISNLCFVCYVMYFSLTYVFYFCNYNFCIYEKPLKKLHKQVINIFLCNCHEFPHSLTSLGIFQGKYSLWKKSTIVFYFICIKQQLICVKNIFSNLYAYVS